MQKFLFKEVPALHLKSGILDATHPFTIEGRAHIHLFRHGLTPSRFEPWFALDDYAQPTTHQSNVSD